MELDRREFAALSATAAMFTQPGGARAATAGATPWHQRLNRVLHINFNELDPLDMDVEAYADLLATAKAQVTFLSVTGSLAGPNWTIPIEAEGQPVLTLVDP